MRFGAMNFPIRPVVEEIRAIGALGFDYLELTLDAPMAHHEVVLREKGPILTALAEHGLGLVCHLPTFVSCADLTPGIREASRAEIRRSLDAAAELGAEKVVAHPPVIGPMGALAQDLVRPLVVEGLNEMLDHAANLGLTVCLENMFPRYGVMVEPEEFRPVFEARPDLKLTLDTGHAFIQGEGEKRLFAFVETWGRRLGHLHVSDNQGRRDDHLPVGRGKVPFSRLAKALKYRTTLDTVTLEIFTGHREDLVHSRETFQRYLDAA
jgi:sugar phosphate isomerase/epimerase